MRSPQRKRGAGAAWRLACALLISVHAAAAHERPAAAIANALVVANEQRASIDVPSATKSDTGSSSAGLQSVALLYRGATNLAPVVGSALLLASAVPARSSAWRAPVFGYLLFPGGFVRAAAVRGAARDNTINNFPSVATGVVPQERRQLSGYVMTDSNIKTAVETWFLDRSDAEATYGHISTWETSQVTDMACLFAWDPDAYNCPDERKWYSYDPYDFNDDISAWDTGLVKNMHGMFGGTRYFNQPIGGWDVELVTDIAIMVRLRSPRVAQFYGVVTTNSTFLGLVMEYCPGGSLRDALNTDDEITSDRRRIWVSDVALGMSYLYSQGVEHRDLKALNVLLTHDLRCKVTDFGLSKCEDLKTTATATMGGAGLAGTPAFMAPELLEDNTFTEKSDVYSFAFVIFEIWSREQPWDGLQPAQIISKVLVKKARPEAPNMPDDLRKLMVRAWAHKPGARPSFREIAAAVRVSTPRGAGPDALWEGGAGGTTAQDTTKSMGIG